MALAEPVRSKLQKAREVLEAEGSLLPKERLAECYSLFRKRFGPEILRELDGSDLLEIMHLHGSRDSLVYWLEFKGDDEFPAGFGSIAGGSALKFGIYKRKETGLWMTGHAAKQIELTTEEAIGIATRHRDQLVAASNFLDKFTENGSDLDYADLQKKLEELAQNVHDSAWGHKYLSLLHHTKLDDYHSDEFHEFHLIKALQIPPFGKGKYLPAGRFVGMATELGVPLNHLGTILNRANGRPRRVWRVGTRVTSDGQADVSIWPLMRDASIVAIGWDELGDLGWVEKTRESKEELKLRSRTWRAVHARLCRAFIIQGLKRTWSTWRSWAPSIWEAGWQSIQCSVIEPHAWRDRWRLSYLEPHLRYRRSTWSRR